MECRAGESPAYSPLTKGEDLIDRGPGLLLFLGICVGSWGLTRWLSNRIESLIETKAVLQLDIKEQRQTVEGGVPNSGTASQEGVAPATRSASRPERTG